MANVSHSTLTGSSLHVAGPLTRVRVVVTTAVTLASDLENGDSYDGVTLATGDRVLLTANGADNGIRVVAASGAPTRATDFDTAADMQRGLPIFVEEGDANGGTVWIHTTSTAITVNTTALTFAGPIGAGGGGGGTLTVANDTGSPMTKGTVAVFAYGSVGGVLTAEPYQGNGSWDTAFRGVLAEDIADGATGTLVTQGEVTGLDTSAFTAGNPLYSDASAQLTETNSPYYEVIAECVVSDATAGVVRVDPHYEAVPPHGHYADQVGGLVNINALAADASPDGAADYVMTYDASASTNKKVLLDDLPAGGTLDINGLTEDTTPAGTDFLPSYDVSATANKKVKPQNLPAFTGDSGSGGVRGQVPAPAGGDAAAGKYLKADGSWDVPSGTGAVASDPIWDAKGDLAAGTGANTASKLTVGANDTILMADSGQSTGLKWVASQTPSTQAFGDAAAEGTADTYARGDHKHGMPANPGGAATFKHTILNGNGNKTTTSTTFVAIDSTNLPYLTLTLAIGDVVRCILQGQTYNSGTSGAAFDVEVDQPTSADTRIGAGADNGAFLQTVGGDRRANIGAVMHFVATEAGVHGFRPMWRTLGGTQTLANATSGNDDSVVLFSAEKLGAVTP